MRWFSSFALGIHAVVLAVACGPAFTEGTGRPDGATRDGPGSDDARDGGGGDVATTDGAGDGTTSVGDALDTDGPDALRDAEPPPPHCGGQFACAPAVPFGWTGPLELYAGPRPPGACTAHFVGPSFAGTADLVAPTPMCGCQCGAPQNLKCAAPTVSFYPSMCATANPCATVDLVPGVCTAVDKSASCLLSVSGISMSIPAAKATGGSCTTLATSAVSVATWNTNARACLSAAGASQVDCQAGEVCAPIPAAPYSASLCISHVGDVACPATAYATRQVYYGAVDDTRNCSSCTCGPVTGASCAASLDVYGSMSMPATCAGPKVTYQSPISCAPVTQPASFLLTLSPSAGSCVPSPSIPTGSATPLRPTTVCCM